MSNLICFNLMAFRGIIGHFMLFVCQRRLESMMIAYLILGWGKKEERSTSINCMCHHLLVDTDGEVTYCKITCRLKSHA